MSVKTLVTAEAESNILSAKRSADKQVSSALKTVDDTKCVRLSPDITQWLASVHPGFTTLPTRLTTKLNKRKNRGLPYRSYLYYSPYSLKEIAQRPHTDLIVPFPESEESRADKLSGVSGFPSGDPSDYGLVFLEGEHHKPLNTALGRVLSPLLPTSARLRGDSDIWYAFIGFWLLLVPGLLFWSVFAGLILGLLLLSLYATAAYVHTYTLSKDDIQEIVCASVSPPSDLSEWEVAVLEQAQNAWSTITGSYAWKSGYAAKFGLPAEPTALVSRVVTGVIDLANLRSQISGNHAHLYDQDAFSLGKEALLNEVKRLVALGILAQDVSEALRVMEVSSRLSVSRLATKVVEGASLSRLSSIQVEEQMIKLSAISSALQDVSKQS